MSREKSEGREKRERGSDSYWRDRGSRRNRVQSVRRSARLRCHGCREWSCGRDRQGSRRFRRESQRSRDQLRERRRPRSRSLGCRDSRSGRDSHRCRQSSRENQRRREPSRGRRSFHSRRSRRWPFWSEWRRRYRGEPERKGQGSTIFIDNLNRLVDVKALRWLFRLEGPIGRIFIARKRRPNNPRTFAFVSLSSTAQVQQAVERINGRFFMGFQIYVRRLRDEAKGGVGHTVPSSSQQGTKVGHGVASNVAEDAQSTDCDKENDGTGNCGGEAGKAPLDGAKSVGGGLRPQMGGGRADPLKNSNGQPHAQVQVNCCCRDQVPMPEENFVPNDGGMSFAKPKERDGAFDVGGNAVGNIAQNGGWSVVPTNFLGWVFQWVPMQSYDQLGWWGYTPNWGGGYLWPYVSGMNWFPAGFAHSYQPFAQTGLSGGLHGVSNQRIIGSGAREPISIRNPPSRRVADRDPIVDDIVSKERRRAEDDSAWFAKIGSAGLFEAGGDLSRPSDVSAVPQMQVEEEDDVDSGLRNLFEDPEFPPGFEPAGGSTGPDADADEAYVQEEAKQTLILAKELGCSVPDEERTLGNLAVSPAKMEQDKTRMFRVKKTKKPNKKFANISAEARECFKYGQRLRIHCPYPRRSLANIDRILRGSGMKK